VNGRMVLMEFSHLDEEKRPRMVNVSAKEPTLRVAVARGTVVMRPETVAAIEGGTVAKGNVFDVAKVAGIMAAKRTADMIPMCHPLELTGVDIDFVPDAPSGTVVIEARVTNIGRTGVEMEAMTAVSVAALTVYDMCKSADRGIVITDVKLMKKDGGRSGLFERKD